MGNNKMKRRQYYIDKRFQTAFIGKFVLVLLLGAILSVVITMFSTQATLTSTFDGSRLVIEKTSIAILPSVIFTSLITTGVLGIIVIGVTLLVSHKIAGPMYRFEKDLEEIAKGDLQKRIHIRNGDQFTSVAKNLNDMVTGLNTRLLEVRERLDRVTVSAAAQNVPQPILDELASCRQSLDENFKL